MDALVTRTRTDNPSLRRSWMWLLAFVILHLVAISRQVDVDGVSLFERTVVALFAPLQNGVSSGAASVAGAWRSFVDLRSIGAENEQLKERLKLAEMQLLTQRAAVEENERLRVYLELKPRLPMATILADVVARNASPWFNTIQLNKGTAHGVLLGATVLTPSGVLGRVIRVSPNAASVQLLVDRDSGAAVLTEKGRVDGVVSGYQDEGDGSPLLLMKYVPSLAPVNPGEVVVTSGLDQLFEKGLVVGTVLRVAEPVGLFKDVWVRPSASPAFAEQVFISMAAVDKEADGAGHP
jgi:rod shape-determining protein MreC